MVNPLGDSAEHKRFRRRDQEPPRPGSVFAPDYDAGRHPASDQSGPANGLSGPNAVWYGSTAGGAAGKGPVRGYPPIPGQPPPMYPPGQFAAWNRGHDRAAGTGTAPGLPGRGEPSRTQSGPHTGPGPVGAGRSGASRFGTSGPARTDSGPFARPGGRPGDAAPPGSRYYGPDPGPDADPGYSLLAVSDPAADVTSTQTWRAAGDGRATGTWTAHSGPGDPGRAGRSPFEPEPGLAPDRQPDPDAYQDGRGQAAPARAGGRAATLGRAGATAAQRTSTDDLAGNRPSEPGRRGTRGHSAARTRLDQPAGPDEPGRARTSRPRRRHQANIRVAMAVSLILVLAAAAALSYAVFRGSGTPRAAGPGASKPAVSPSATTTPSLGPYGHISSRAEDPTPLTVAELYPASFTAGGANVLRTASDLSSHCTAHLVGAAIQAAIGSAGCTQVVRATYLASTPGLMGTIGVLNLNTAKAAASAAHSADGSDFIGQLAPKHGPTHRIGQGTGIEEAVAKGHYLILIWAEFTSLRNPKTAGQRTAIEQFLTELLDSTANVGLSQRMASGTP